MDERRWSREDAVRRDDESTRAPAFRDEHESDHLPQRGRLSAAWHGMSTGRRVMVASALAVLSMVGGAGIFTTLDDFGRGVGTQPEAHGPVAADGATSPLPHPEDAGAAVGEAPGALLNTTQPAPSPSSLPLPASLGSSWAARPPS